MRFLLPIGPKVLLACFFRSVAEVPPKYVPRSPRADSAPAEGARLAGNGDRAGERHASFREIALEAGCDAHHHRHLRVAGVHRLDDEPLDGWILHHVEDHVRLVDEVAGLAFYGGTVMTVTRARAHGDVEPRRREAVEVAELEGGVVRFHQDLQGPRAMKHLALQHVDIAPPTRVSSVESKVTASSELHAEKQRSERGEGRQRPEHGKHDGCPGPGMDEGSHT